MPLRKTDTQREAYALRKLHGVGGDQRTELSLADTTAQRQPIKTTQTTHVNQKAKDKPVALPVEVSELRFDFNSAQ